jgi:hypothetical protein
MIRAKYASGFPGFIGGEDAASNVYTQQCY